MDRQTVGTGAAALERIACALERIGSSLDLMSGAAINSSSFHHASASRGLWTFWRGRAVTSSTDEPPKSPLRLLQTLDPSRPLDYIANEAAGRRTRPWIGLVGVALAAMAAMLVGDWWLLPLLAICAWWWCPQEWHGTWLVPLLRASVGVLWVSLGVGLFVLLPLPFAGLIWAAMAVSLAGVGVVIRAKTNVDGCDPR
jgi:hypothetical protein